MGNGDLPLPIFLSYFFWFFEISIGENSSHSIVVVSPYSGELLVLVDLGLTVGVIQAQWRGSA